MKQKRHTVDQIMAKLRRADVELGNGSKVADVCKMLSITEQTYYRWRQKYGVMQPEMAQQLKVLQPSLTTPERKITAPFSRAIPDSGSP